MRIITILLATIAMYSTAFYRPKCEHVFTQVEQATVKIEPASIYGSSVYAIGYFPSGLQDGKELNFVKCFHKQKQVVDYGQPATGLRLSDFPIDTLRTGSVVIDTSMNRHRVTLEYRPLTWP
jgi:hypothetical protein